MSTLIEKLIIILSCVYRRLARALAHIFVDRQRLRRKVDIVVISYLYSAENASFLSYKSQVTTKAIGKAHLSLSAVYLKVLYFRRYCSRKQEIGIDDGSC